MIGGDIIHVACTADEAYAPHCAAMLASLFEHNEPAGVEVHYLHPADLRMTTRNAIEAFVTGFGARIRCHAFAEEAVAGLPSWPGLQPIMWYRVLLPERVPDLDRILYIDADALVLDDLRPLWRMDLRGAWLAAVTNVLPPIFADHPLELGLPDQAHYFNSGVMLLNLARMRREGSSRSLVEEGRRRALRFWDQDGLNLAFHRDWLPVHPRWNCMNSLFLFPAARLILGRKRVEEAMANPAIVHFEGPGLGKPWHFLSKHPFQPHYLRYRQQTPWPLTDLEGRTVRNRLLRLLPTRVILEVVGLAYRARTLARALRRKLGRFVRSRAGP